MIIGDDSFESANAMVAGGYYNINF